MTRVIATVVAVLAWAAPTLTTPLRAADFFAAAPDRGQDLPADHIYPRGRMFPFSFISAYHARDIDFRKLKADGINMIGPHYGLFREALDAAETHGLKMVYAIGYHPEKEDGWLAFHNDSHPAFDPVAARKAVADKVRKLAQSDAIAWWGLFPEELRFWRKNEMQYLEAIRAGIRDGDPQNRPVWMYEPNNRTAAALVKTMTNQDICGRGIYANYASRREDRVWVRWGIEEQVEAIRLANQPQVVPIAVPEMFQQPANEHAHLPVTWARHDTYLSMICGARGVVVYSMAHRNGFTAHKDYYEGYASVARELNGPLQLGRVFLFGSARNDLRLDVTTGPATVTLTANVGTKIEGGKLDYPSIATANIAYLDRRYLFAVNSANEPVKATLRGLPAGPILMDDLFDDADAVPVKGTQAMSFNPLQVRAWILNRGENQ